MSDKCQYRKLTQVTKYFDTVGCDISNRMANSCSSRFRRRCHQQLVHWMEFGSGSILTLAHLSPVCDHELIDGWPKKCIKCDEYSKGRKSCSEPSEGVITFQSVDSKLTFHNGILYLFCEAIQLTQSRYPAVCTALHLCRC